MTDTADDRNPTSASETSRAEAPERVDFLDRKAIGGLTVEHLAYIVLAIVGIVSRLYIAGERPLHHDESIHAVFSWKIVTEGIGSYRYDPVYHGPVLYYWTALLFRLFGDSDFVSRLSPILFGFGLMGLAWPLRRFIGRTGALVFLVLVTVSPSWLYFTRFLRHDIYVAFCNLAAVIAAFRYAQTMAPRFLYASALLIALSFATKEDLYALFPIMLISAFFMLVWEVVYARDRQQAWVSVRAEVGEFFRRAALPLVGSLIIFIIVWLVFYTSFLSHPENWNAVTPAITYWLGQHQIQRIGGPWWYYFPHMVFYEQLIFFPALLFLLTPLLRPRPNEPKSTLYLVYATWGLTAVFFVTLFAYNHRAHYVLLAALTLAGFVHMLRWLPDRFTRFAVVWTIGSFVFYAWAQEKVPWLLVPILTPMVLLSAVWLRNLIESGAIRQAPAAAMTGALLVLTVWIAYASTFVSDAPRPSEPKERRTGDLLAYVQSTYDIHEKVMVRIDEIAEKLGTGTATRLAISGDATWPMSWYVRHYPVNWGAGLRKVDFPVLIVDVDAANSLRSALSEKYEEQRFQIRGWWEPNWSQMNLANLARWIFTREAFSGVGSSDAVMFSLREVEPGMQIVAIEVNPPPPPRGYPGKPEEIAPAGNWGRQGSGPGEFNEPRALTIDGRGHIYVADSKNHRVQKLAPDGRHIASWGTKGEGAAQFNDPCGIVASSDGFIYVADTWNHRIQKFDTEGKFILEWRDESGFWGPRGIAVSPDGKSLYVTDTGNKRVVRYDPNGQRLGVWGSEGTKTGEFIEPVGIAVDPEGRVIVADTGNRRLQVFDAEGTFIEAHLVSGWEEFYSEPYIAVASDGAIIVSDSYNHRVARYVGGTLTTSWGKSGSKGGEFNRPIGVAADNQGGIYVSDTLNHRIQKFFLPE